MPRADSAEDHDDAEPQEREHQRRQQSGLSDEDCTTPIVGVHADAEHNHEEHRQNAEQTVAGEQQTPVQAHAYRIAHDPAPPASPFLAQRLAFLRIDDGAADVPDLVPGGNQRPGQVEVLDIGAIRDADLAQDVGAEHAARARDDERRTAEDLLEGPLDDDHRQLDARPDISKQPAATKVRGRHTADGVGAAVELSEHVAKAAAFERHISVRVGEEDVLRRRELETLHDRRAFAAVVFAHEQEPRSLLHQLRGNLRGGVGRSVIDADHAANIRISQQVDQRPRDDQLLVEGGNDHVD